MVGRGLRREAKAIRAIAETIVNREIQGEGQGLASRCERIADQLDHAVAPPRPASLVSRAPIDRSRALLDRLDRRKR